MGFDRNYIELHKKVTQDTHKAVKQQLQNIINQFDTEQASYLELIILGLLEQWQSEDLPYLSSKNNILLRIRKCMREARMSDENKVIFSPILMKGIDYIYQNLIDKQMTDQFNLSKRPENLIHLALMLIRSRLHFIRLGT